MSNNQPLLEVAKDVYEGISPTKGEVRKFIKLPPHLNEDEKDSLNRILRGIPLPTRVDEEDMNVLVEELDAKVEIIDGEPYFRFLATADTDKLREKAEKVQTEIQRINQQNELRGERRR